MLDSDATVHTAAAISSNKCSDNTPAVLEYQTAGREKSKREIRPRAGVKFFLFNEGYLEKIGFSNVLFLLLNYLPQ